MGISAHPSHGSRRAAFPHRALASGMMNEYLDGRWHEHLYVSRTWSGEGFKFTHGAPVQCLGCGPSRGSSLDQAPSLHPLRSRRDWPALFANFLGTTHLSDFSCPFIELCSEGLPEYPVSLLPGGQVVADQLVAAGYDDLRLVPEHGRSATCTGASGRPPARGAPTTSLRRRLTWPPCRSRASTSTSRRSSSPCRSGC